MKNFTPTGIFFLLLFLFAGYVTTFISGIFFSHLLIPTKTPVSPTPTPTIQNGIEPTPKFVPGKYYFDDTILMIEKNVPHRTLVATVTRAEQNGNYIQNTRVSFYDGNSWTRKTESKNTTSNTIVPSSIISSWVTTIDDSRVLKEETSGTGRVDAKAFLFSTGPLTNEISMRSLPGYTKFMSEGRGKFTLEGKTVEAYVLYTRIYSQNAADIQFYNAPLGLTTDWIAFWDTDGNFYHIDATSVKNPTPIYKTHQIGVVKQANGAVNKTFQLDIERDTTIPPDTYTIFMHDPVNTTLHLTRKSTLNKMPNNSYAWFLGHTDGFTDTEGRTITGIGLVEFIQD